MESLIIHSTDKKDLNLLQEPAQKMGLKTHVLNSSEKEDMAIASAIQHNDPTENLSLKDAIAYYQTLDKAE